MLGWVTAWENRRAVVITGPDSTSGRVSTPKTLNLSLLFCLVFANEGRCNEWLTGISIIHSSADRMTYYPPRNHLSEVALDKKRHTPITEPFCAVTSTKKQQQPISYRKLTPTTVWNVYLQYNIYVHLYLHGSGTINTNSGCKHQLRNTYFPD